jgi:hypothetical protein
VIALLESDTAESSVERDEAKFLWPPLILAIVLLWIVPMTTSLGLDETGNWWVIKDGFKEMIPRARIWSGGQSLLFNSLVLGARAIFGDYDFVMRLPSILAMFGALYMLYRLGKRLMGPLAAMCGCLVFVCLPDVIYVASTVRPYALGVFFVIGAMLSLVNWIDTGEFRYRAAYAILAALSLYATYFYALGYLVHALYAIFRILEGKSLVGFRALILTWTGSLLLLLPLAPQVILLFSQRAEQSYGSEPSITEFLRSLAPIELTGSIVLAILIAFLLRQKPRIEFAPFSATGFFLAAWALIPVGILCVVSLVTPIKVFMPRYYLTGAPALAMLAGALIRSIYPARSRLLAAGSVAVCTVLAVGVGENFNRGTTDWRAAAQAVREHVGDSRIPVITVPGFYQARTVALISDPELRDVVFAPYLRYSIAGQIIRVPEVLLPDGLSYLENSVVPQLEGQREFLIVGLSGMETFEHWFIGRLGSSFRDRTLGYYGGVKVVVFERITK